MARGSDSDRYTRIPIMPDTRNMLRQMKAQEGDSYDSLLRKMADDYEMEVSTG